MTAGGSTSPSSPSPASKNQSSMRWSMLFFTSSLRVQFTTLSSWTMACTLSAASTQNISTFAGFAPLENPAAVVTISLDEPMEGGRTGGAVSAPAFADVMAETLRLLHVEPDYYMPPAVDAPVKAQQAKSDASAAAGRGGKRG